MHTAQRFASRPLFNLNSKEQHQYNKKNLEVLEQLWQHMKKNNMKQFHSTIPIITCTFFFVQLLRVVFLLYAVDVDVGADADHSEECGGGISLHDCPSWWGELIHKMHCAVCSLTTVRNAGVGSASMIARVGGVSQSTKCTVLPDNSEECGGGISLHDSSSWRGESIHKMHCAPWPQWEMRG